MKRGMAVHLAVIEAKEHPAEAEEHPTDAEELPKRVELRLFLLPLPRFHRRRWRNFKRRVRDLRSALLLSKEVLSCRLPGMDKRAAETRCNRRSASAQVGVWVGVWLRAQRIRTVLELLRKSRNSSSFFVSALFVVFSLISTSFFLVPFVQKCFLLFWFFLLLVTKFYLEMYPLLLLSLWFLFLLK